MIHEETKRKILEEILSTKEFHSSKTYTKLLTYLVEASISGKEPKEITIALEVFNKDSSFNPSEDASVRVYISNLRKKLDHYYSHEGENEKYRIRIPKGGYGLEFIPHVSNIKNKLVSFSKPLMYLISLLLLVFFAIILYKSFFSDSSANTNVASTPFWINLVNSNNKKMLVLGNDLFFLEKYDDEEFIVRKHNINTVEEFENYKNNNKERNIVGITPYPFYPEMNFALTTKLIHLVFDNDDFEFNNSMKVTAKDLLENDIVFLGSFRNLHFLNYLMKDSLFAFNSELDNNFLTVYEPDTTIIFKQIGEPDLEYVDYCLFRKIPGPNKNTIYLFVSFFGAARDAAIKKMLNKKYSKVLNKLFQEKYGEMPEYFDVLFKTSGFSRTAFTTKIEFIHKTNSSVKNWW